MKIELERKFLVRMNVLPSMLADLSRMKYHQGYTAVLTSVTPPEADK